MYSIKKNIFIAIGLIVLLLAPPVMAGCAGAEEKALTAFCGSASKPAMDEAIQAFNEDTGIQVYGNYGGSGTMLSQMELSKSGDLYIPGSPDYIVKAEQKGVIDPSSVKIVAYLIPVIAVQHGNPQNIKSLDDLTRPGLKIAIGNPEAVCLGLYAVEILEYNHRLADVSRNIVTHAESCEKTAALLSLKTVDAVIGWDVFHHWNPDSIDVVYLEPGQLPRIAYIPGAVSNYAKDKAGAQQFLDFLVSPAGQEIFKKWGYITTEDEARKFAPDARIGGEYELPVDYQPPVK